MPTPLQPLTAYLDAAANGDDQAQRILFDLAYDELKRIARRTLGKGQAPRPVNPTTLVHEAYLKIARGQVRGLQDSRHFYSLFARAMRQVLVDLSRQAATARHGGGLHRTDLGEEMASGERSLDELLEIEAALQQLEQADPELAELVEWHFHGGLSFVDIAAARGVTERTVRRHWDMARSYLLDALPAAGG